MNTQEIEAGDLVIVYDCQMANKDRDYSGKNKKYWPVATVVSIYEYDGDLVANVLMPDGRISEAHFVSGLKLVLKGNTQSTHPSPSTAGGVK